MDSYLKLAIAALIPVVAAAVFYKIDNVKQGKLTSSKGGQVIIGIVFGAIAVLGTEWGIPLEGAVVNCRDAAPLIAGFFFGGPAGIIAGTIGGVERWIAVAWGVGKFTRLACSVSTFLSGIYAAFFRKYMFDNKKPGWGMAFMFAGSMEVFHLNMVFVTNLAQVEKALRVCKVCTMPMVIAVACSVGLAGLVLAFMSDEKFSFEQKNRGISQTIQRWLMVLVVVAFLITNLFMQQVQINLNRTSISDNLSQEIDDAIKEVKDHVDSALLDSTLQAKDLYQGGERDLYKIAKAVGVSEINIADSKGIITETTEPDYVGFDFHSGAQARQFLVLLGNAATMVQDYQSITYSEDVKMKYAGAALDTGFIQCGYDVSKIDEVLSALLASVADNRHVGNKGFIIVSSKTGAVVSMSGHQGVGLKLLDTELFKTFMNSEDGEVMDVVYDKVEYLAMGKHTETGAFIVFSLLPKSEAVLSREVALYINSYMQVLIFSILFALIYFLIKRVVVRNIDKVNDNLSEITGGNLNVQVNVRETSEFASLSDDINSTVDTLKHYIDEAAARIDKELEFAKSIQSSALPSVFPAFPKRKDFDIYARMDTAKEVGGDFYDFYMTNNDTLNFLIADVSGKGIPAALFMMRAKVQLKTLTETDIPISEVFTVGNANLCEGNDAGMFVTAWQGSIDLKTGHVGFANAGHNPPLVKHNGKFEYLKSRPGLVLAGMEGLRYRYQELQMDPGDIIYLYTDGVTEATDAHDELYGEERLLNLLNSRDFRDVKELCDAVKADVDLFVGEAPQFDDITMVALRYDGPDNNGGIKLMKEITVDAKIDSMNEVLAFVDAELEALDCPMKAQAQIDVAIDELFSNIAFYAYHPDTGPATVRVEVEEDPLAVIITFLDNGMPYDPLSAKEPDTTLSAEDRPVGGLGVLIVKKSMDDVSYEYKDGQNILTIKKNL